MAAAAQGQGVVKVELQLRLQVKGLDVVDLQVEFFSAGPAPFAVYLNSPFPDLFPAGRSRRQLGQFPPGSGHQGLMVSGSGIGAVGTGSTTESSPGMTGPLPIGEDSPAVETALVVTGPAPSLPLCD